MLFVILGFCLTSDRMISEKKTQSSGGDEESEDEGKMLSVSGKVKTTTIGELSFFT